jgi:hypothetical protein
VQVRHAGGPHYGKPVAEKDAYWERYHAVEARKDAVKAALLRIPLVRRLNARHGWFVAPEAAADAAPAR